MRSLRETILQAGGKISDEDVVKQAKLEARQDLEDEVSEGMAKALTLVDGIYATGN